MVIWRKTSVTIITSIWVFSPALEVTLHNNNSKFNLIYVHIHSIGQNITLAWLLT